MEYGWSLPRRLDLLARLNADKRAKHTWPVEFQGHVQHLQVEHVPIAMPKYRLANGRTTSLQASFLAQHDDLPADFFDSDPESDDAQGTQHELLTKVIADAGLLSYFKKSDQSQPLVLTATGFVLNGNRRLCAMRKLFEESGRFADISVVVLPDSDERQLSDLEFALQIREDIQADYTWTAQALMFKQRMDKLGYKPNEIAQKAGKPESSVRELLDMLSYADDYLKRRGKAHAYSLVDRKEFAFRTLIAQRKKVDGDDKELVQLLGYSVIDEPEGGRAYGTIGDLAAFLPKIKEALQSFITDDDRKIAANPKVDELLGSSDVELEYEPLIRVLEDFERADEVRHALVSVVTAQKALDQERKRTDFVLIQASKANQALTNAVTAVGDGMARAGLAEQIDQIEARCAELRKWANATRG